MPGTAEPPLLVTCLLDSNSQDYFQNLRDLYFPRERNVVPAHLSLFHNLPTTHRPRVEVDLQRMCNRLPFNLEVQTPKLMGSGVMFELQSTELNKMHADLATCFEPWLIPQDRQKFKSHVVVQNKVTNEQAQQTLAKIADAFQPFTAQVVGLCLWTYLSGPWRLEQQFVFKRDIIELAE